MDTPDDSAPDKNSADKAEPEALGGDAAANDLPHVDSPRLAAVGAAEEASAGAAGDRAHTEVRGTLPALFRGPAGDDYDEAPEEPAPAATAQPRSFRFALLAASVAAAAGIGALVGALAASGFSHQRPVVAAIPRTADAHDVIAALKAQLTELSALKASIDAAKGNAGAQFAKISERLDSLERKQAAAAPEITGSIAAPAPPAVPAPAPSANLSAPILHDWVVQDVRNGRAMVEASSGSFFLVGSGSVLPGLGRVQDVKRQNGEWIVVTDKGLITSRP